ncbi:MFS general substrate transporter [Phellopilus nigrolimitatus]|nr:MFS general substrate transporter [Phellopilus nigrolimitatus]
MAPSESEARARSQTSKSRSRQRRSHHASSSSVPYLSQGPDALLLPEGPVTEEAVELLHEFVHPRHRDKHRADPDGTLVEETVESAEEESGGEDVGEEEDREALKLLPWYRRPSPLWLLCMMPITSMAMSACAAPRVEIYTQLACLEHKPEYTVGRRANIDNFYGIGELNSFKFNDDYAYPDANISSMFHSKPFYAVYEGYATRDEETNKGSKCASDPTVQAAVAKLIAVMTTTMGILSCLTTAFWGSLSDRYGRLRVLGLNVIGLLLTDFNFIIVCFFSKKLPGGYWFILLGAFADGALGGISSVVAAMHAYMADCVTPEARSRVFSLSLGLLFVGMALGPSLGSLLIHVTQQTLSVFYFATAVHVIYALLLWFVVPESLALRAMSENRARKVRRAEEERQAEAEAIAAGRNEGCGLRIVMKLKKVFAFLSPLSIFAPKRVKTEGYLGKKRRDWSLTFIAVSYGLSALVMASYQYVFQYAAATFGWSSEELGYWLSLVGASRAIYLTLVLPLVIKIFNRPKHAVQLPIEPSEPLQGLHDAESSLEPDAGPERPHKQHADAKLAPHTPSFDLGLARASLVLEAVCYSFIPLAPSAHMFLVFGMLVSWGGGFNPAVQALALELYTRRSRKQGGAETGRLFGAMSVVQVMCAQIIGPAIFGLTYMKTVATYPRAIFWVSSGSMIVSLIFICLVRLPRSAHAAAAADVEDPPQPYIDREATLVDSDENGEDGQSRGRNAGKVAAARLV